MSAQRLANAGITVDSWAADIRAGTLRGHVCDIDGAMAGYCFGAPDTGEVVVLALLPEFERRGIGKALLSLVVEDLVGVGHRRLFLGCAKDESTRSHGFYRHLGWRSTGRDDAHGDEVLELVPSEGIVKPAAP